MNIGLEKYRYYHDILRFNELFKTLSQKSISDLLEIANAQYCPEKTCILNTNVKFFHFYIIISGRIKAYNFDMQKDRQLTLFLLAKNDVFDIFSLLKDGSHKIYYETLEKTEVLSIPLSKMRLWMEQYPGFNKVLAAYVTHKMGTLQEYVKDIVLEKTPARLAKLLYQNMNSNSGKIEKINDLSHVELAALIGTTRAVVNRHLQEFKRDGIIKISRKHLEIIDLELLREKFEA